MTLSTLKYTETQLFYNVMSCYTQFSPMTYRTIISPRLACIEMNLIYCDVLKPN